MVCEAFGRKEKLSGKADSHVDVLHGCLYEFYFQFIIASRINKSLQLYIIWRHFILKIPSLMIASFLILDQNKSCSKVAQCVSFHKRETKIINFFLINRWNKNMNWNYHHRLPEFLSNTVPCKSIYFPWSTFTFLSCHNLLHIILGFLTDQQKVKLNCQVKIPAVQGSHESLLSCALSSPFYSLSSR